MITGPVTNKENNPSKIWGSWVYQGNILTIEIKTPTATLSSLVLHANNIAYGYKEIYKSIKVGGFGQSGPCEINVVCPLGNGWEGERNSVSTILSANGGEFCTGSLVMNTCGTNTPYYLTANHCFDGNTAGWRFAFQAWSTTCPNPGVNTNGVIYNGSTLRARNGASDFCLVELNTVPPANSGLHYAGWTSSTTPAQNATAIHHPRGDLMKISRANNPVTVGSFAGTTNQHWRANWSQQNNGNGQTVTAVTEGGSSGSPLFDQNHRIIGQLHGGPSVCNGSQLWDFYGRFDLSWTGGGNNTSRLSSWLDPNNTGAVTTNTTNVSNLIPTQLFISGNDVFCSGSSQYSLNVPSVIPLAWQSSNTYIASVPPTGNPVTATKNADGAVTLTATINTCNTSISTTKLVSAGLPNIDFVTFSNPNGEPSHSGSSMYGFYDWCSNMAGNEFNIQCADPTASFEYEVRSYPSMNLYYSGQSGSVGTVGYLPPSFYIFRARPTGQCGTGNWFETEVGNFECSAGGGEDNGGGGNGRAATPPKSKSTDKTNALEAEQLSKKKSEISITTHKIVQNVYPNPASSFIQVELNCPTSQTVKIDVVDAVGVVRKAVFVGKLPQGLKTIKITGFTTGSYRLRVLSDQGSEYYQFLIIK